MRIENAGSHWIERAQVPFYVIAGFFVFVFSFGRRGLTCYWYDHKTYLRKCALLKELRAGNFSRVNQSFWSQTDGRMDLVVGDAKLHYAVDYDNGEGYQADVQGLGGHRHESRVDEEICDILSFIENPTLSKL